MIQQFLGWEMLGLDAGIDPYPCFPSFPSFIAYLYALCDAYSLLPTESFIVGLYFSAEGIPIQGPGIASEWIDDGGAASSYHKAYASCQWSDSMACAGAPVTVRCVISDAIELIIKLRQPCRDTHLATRGILCNAQQLIIQLLVICNYTQLRKTMLSFPEWYLGLL